MSRKYIKQRIYENFIYPNNTKDEYDIDIVHDINDNCVSGDINTFSATTLSSTGITIQYSFDWDTNGAELFQMDNGDYSYVSVHMMGPTQNYFKPYRVAFNIQNPTLYTGTTTFTGSTVVTPDKLGLTGFTNGTYYYEVRFIGHRCLYPVCGSFEYFVGPTPTPTATPTPTPTPTPTLCTCISYTLNNTGSTSFLVSYQECPYGETVINFVANSGQTYNFCACQDSVGYEGGSPAQLINNGPCNITPTPTSTPTVTPTITPTITPTPTTGSCECYWFLNETGGMLNYTYDDCVAGTTMETLAGGASAYECVVVGSTIIADPGITVTQCEVSCTTTCLPCA